MSALPEAAWEDHLVPLLWRKEAVRLECTCKALRRVVREHYRGELGCIRVKELRAALTTFPRARELFLRDSSMEWAHGEKEALLQWLREGGRGSYLANVDVDGDFASGFVLTAIREGALPSLEGFRIRLHEEIPRAILTEGYLGGIRELWVTINRADVHQLAALGLVGQLPCLTRLKLSHNVDNVGLMQWPPFIPRSLKALSINMWFQKGPGIESLLGALPDLVGTGGVGLESFKLTLPAGFTDLGDGLVHLAQVLRCCSPTLKGFFLSTEHSVALGLAPREWDAFLVERRRLEWADVLAGVAACRELQVLVLPNTEVEPLFPPGTSLARLTHLEISDSEPEHPPDVGVMGLWELMASGGLPALAKLSVRLERRCWGAEKVRSRVVPAFEAVGGTLTNLRLLKGGFGEFGSDDLEECSELGVGVGKLRRLRDLTLDLFRDGRAYHAFAQGLAASGGGPPLPLLWRVGLISTVYANADLLASLLLPSMRVFRTCFWNTRGPLLTACGMRQVGYKHIWGGTCREDVRDAVREITECTLVESVLNVSDTSWNSAM
jgi:hypothetical protein